MMKIPATPFFKFFGIVVLLLGGLVFSGCESTTTVNDGFGMTFTETSEEQADRVNID